MLIKLLFIKRWIDRDETDEELGRKGPDGVTGLGIEAVERPGGWVDVREREM